MGPRGIPGCTSLKLRSRPANVLRFESVTDLTCVRLATSAAWFFLSWLSKFARSCGERVLTSRTPACCAGTCTQLASHIAATTTATAKHRAYFMTDLTEPPRAYPASVLAPFVMNSQWHNGGCPSTPRPRYARALRSG